MGVAVSSSLSQSIMSQGQALAGLEDYIADKAITDYYVEFLPKQVVPFHVADEI